MWSRISSTHVAASPSGAARATRSPAPADRRVRPQGVTVIAQPPFATERFSPRTSATTRGRPGRVAEIREIAHRRQCATGQGMRAIAGSGVTQRRTLGAAGSAAGPRRTSPASFHRPARNARASPRASARRVPPVVHGGRSWRAAYRLLFVVRPALLPKGAVRGLAMRWRGDGVSPGVPGEGPAPEGAVPVSVARRRAVTPDAARPAVARGRRFTRSSSAGCRGSPSAAGRPTASR